MLAELAGSIDSAIFTGLPTEALKSSGRPGASAWNPEELADLARQMSLVAETALTPGEALERARELATEKGGAVLMTGSHYLFASSSGTVGSG